MSTSDQMTLRPKPDAIDRASDRFYHDTVPEPQIADAGPGHTFKHACWDHHRAIHYEEPPCPICAARRQPDEPLGYWKEREMNAAHVALDKLGAARTKVFTDYRHPEQLPREITIGLAERIGLLNPVAPPGADLRAALKKLIQEWRAEKAQIDSFHATMGTGYGVCAERLAALLDAPKEKP